MNVKNCITKISLEEAKNAVKSYDYGLIYYMSSMVFDAISNICEINWDECMEAYFFDKEGQLHIYRDEDVLTVQKFSEIETLAMVEKKYELANTFKELGDSVVVREYLEPDEDGQMYVAYKRLCTVEHEKGGENNG